MSIGWSTKIYMSIHTEANESCDTIYRRLSLVTNRGGLMEFIDSIWFIVLFGAVGLVLIYIKTKQQKGGSMKVKDIFNNITQNMLALMKNAKAKGISWTKPFSNKRYISCDGHYQQGTQLLYGLSFLFLKRRILTREKFGELINNGRRMDVKYLKD